MRALETEVSRLREAYTNEISEAKVSIQQHQEMLQKAQSENDILKEILATHGINFASELEQRMADRGAMGGFHSSPVAPSSTGSNSVAFSNTHRANNQSITPATSISPELSPQAVHSVEQPDLAASMGFAPQPQVYHASPSENMAMDRSSAGRILDPAVPTMRGVFESDPQLQIDFILTCVSPDDYKPLVILARGLEKFNEVIMIYFFFFLLTLGQA